LLAAEGKKYNELIDRLYESGSGGRKGIMSLKDSAARSRKNYQQI